MTATTPAHSYCVKPCPSDPRPPLPRTTLSPDPRSPAARASETLKQGPSVGPQQMTLRSCSAQTGAQPSLHLWCHLLRPRTRGLVPPWGAVLHGPASSRGPGSPSAPNHALRRGRASSGCTGLSQNQAKWATTERPEATTPGRRRPSKRVPRGRGCLRAGDLSCPDELSHRKNTSRQTQDDRN